MPKYLGAMTCVISLLVLSGAHAARYTPESAGQTPVQSKVLLAGDTSCRAVVNFVCRWEDDQKYCTRAVEWICD